MQSYDRLNLLERYAVIDSSFDFSGVREEISQVLRGRNADLILVFKVHLKGDRIGLKFRVYNPRSNLSFSEGIVTFHFLSISRRKVIYNAVVEDATKETTEMRCPECKKLLKPDGIRRYETLVEHVSRPNRQWPMIFRRSYICSHCDQKGFYGVGGDVYGRMNDFQPALNSTMDQVEKRKIR